jgi:ribose 5-phosphate isomerase B
MKIALGTDHAGHALKERLRSHLVALGHQVVDFGAFNAESSDYPDFVVPAAEAVARGSCDRGIVLGGSGNGEAIASNKVPGVRAVLAWNAETARLGRQHNDANVLSLGARQVAEADALEMVRLFLETPFEGGRHGPRVAKIAATEARFGSRLP